eukprot:m.154502 g.154502  ORF g.154502 m.154502 type:complete len:118 (-) comp23512_c0_seq1:128-481(-)
MPARHDGGGELDHLAHVDSAGLELSLCSSDRGSATDSAMAPGGSGDPCGRSGQCRHPHHRDRVRGALAAQAQVRTAGVGCSDRVDQRFRLCRGTAHTCAQCSAHPITRVLWVRSMVL